MDSTSLLYCTLQTLNCTLFTLYWPLCTHHCTVIIAYKTQKHFALHTSNFAHSALHTTHHADYTQYTLHTGVMDWSLSGSHCKIWSTQPAAFDSHSTLYWTTLHHTVLQLPILYYTVLQCIPFMHFYTQYNTLFHVAILYWTLLHFSTIQYIALKCHTLYCAVPCAWYGPKYVIHLCFKEAQAKICHTSKVKNKVENKFLTSWTHISGHFFIYELWTAINPKPLELLTSFQHRDLWLSISYYKADTKFPHKSALYLVWLIFFLINLFWLCTAVVSHCQPQSKWLRP